MDIRKIKKLIDLINETGIAEIEIKEGEETVRVSRFGNAGNVNMAPMPMQTHYVAPVAAPAAENTVAKSVATELSAPNGHQVLSPMVGTAYLAPSPGAKAFVEIGQIVNAGDILCVIEAMKMFNQIESDKSGKVVSRLVENGQAVEFDQPLFIIE